MLPSLTVVHVGNDCRKGGTSCRRATEAEEEDHDQGDELDEILRGFSPFNHGVLVFNSDPPMGTAIKHTMPNWVKPSFVIFDIWALSECPDFIHYK